MSSTDAVLALAAARETWSSLVRHDPGGRVYELLRRDDEVEVYLVCWMNGQDTGFHDHDDSAAAILVVEGAIVEERLRLDGAAVARYERGELVEVPPEAIHSVRHAGDAPAVTLHAYSPPLSRVGTYETSSDGTVVRYARDADTPLIAAQGS